jgi:hypothetical protein
MALCQGPHSLLVLDAAQMQTDVLMSHVCRLPGAAAGASATGDAVAFCTVNTHLG